MTDETNNSNPELLRILAERNQTLNLQQTSTVTAAVITSTTTTTIRRIDEYNRRRSSETAQNKRIKIQMANSTAIPDTVKNHTKLAELQILRPEDTKQILPVDSAVLKILDVPDDTHV